MQYIDLTTNDFAAYQLADMINAKHYQNLLVYEIHDFVDPNTIYNCIEGLDGFKERTKKFYGAFLHEEHLIDDEPAIISIAVKVSNEWIIADDCGSNFYGGFGPAGIIKLREACHKNGVRILVVEDKMKNWLKINLPSPKSSSNPKSREAKEFEKITRHFTRLLMNMQKMKDSYKNIKEETIRGTMLPSINAVFKGGGYGEAKNANGKTDILIRSTDNINDYIFELKIWNGIESFKRAILQLQGYLHYNNSHAGIIVFCSNNNFTEILKNVEKHIKETYGLIPIAQQLNDFRFKLPYPSDELKFITTHVFLVNLK